MISYGHHLSRTAATLEEESYTSLVFVALALAGTRISINSSISASARTKVAKTGNK